MNGLTKPVALLLAVAALCLGQEEKPTDPNAEWRKFCDLTAANITIREPKSLGNSNAKVFERHDKAIFEHRNPFNQTEHGLVYLWKQDNGRPAAIFTCLINQSGPNKWGEIIEYHSLHDDRLESSFGSPDADSEIYCRAHQWAPIRGIKWHPLPDSPKPPKSKRLVRIQGQKLVRRFECLGVFGSQEYSLRALTKPVYTYEAEEDGNQIGGLLTFFCRATDPEAILLLELRENEKGELVWHYAVGNFTRGIIKFSLDKADIWSMNTRPFSVWANPQDVHYGGFPYRHKGSFTIEDGIARQQAHLDRLKK